MFIDLTRIKDVEGAVLREQILLDGLREELVDGQSMELKVTHVKGSQFLVEGAARLKVVIPCDRCLTPVETGIDIDLSESDDVAAYLNGDKLDAGRLICDEILIGWPMKTLCSEDCGGIPGDYMKSSPDPRMAAIQDIYNRSREV